MEFKENCVVDTAQLRARGLAQKEITTLVDQRKLHRVEKGVFTTSPPEGKLLLQALRHQRPYLVFTGRTALQIYSGTHVTTPLSGLVRPGHSAHGSALLTLRRRRKVYCREISGVLVSPPLVTVGDCLGEVPDEELIAFLEEQYAGRTGRIQLERELSAVPRLPRKLRDLISRAAIGADSEAEREVFRALRAKGLRVIQNHEIGGYFFDGVLPAVKLIVEIDGFRYHSGEARETFVLDRWKANYAVRNGYRVLRYSGSCVKYHLDRVVEQIAAAADDLEEPLFSEEHQVWRWHETLNRDGPWIREVAQ